MAELWWTGVGAATLIVGVHAGLRVAADRLAHRADDHETFLRFALGGVGVRMAVVLVLTALTLVYVPVHETSFVATLAALLIVSLVLETIQEVRRLNDEPDEK